MSVKLPWDIHPDLTAERLTPVASWIARGRNDALDRYDPSIGDNAWTLGTRAYAYGKFRIEEAARSRRYPWLAILNPTNQFIFQIGAVPVRFYRGPAEEPTARTMRQSYPELKQLSLMLDTGFSWPDMIFRFAVETGDLGEILRIVFVGVIGQSVDLCWEVPLSSAPAVLHPVDAVREDGVVLPPPRVVVPGARTGAAAGTGS